MLMIGYNRDFSWQQLLLKKGIAAQGTFILFFHTYFLKYTTYQQKRQAVMLSISASQTSKGGITKYFRNTL
ncbi:hypothetical protein BIV59_07075 [Bacillus sp. MUM 13]|nr:hypothetical protein BIV59_07075 [Bacillus sp. MUM 13]